MCAQIGALAPWGRGRREKQISHWAGSLISSSNPGPGDHDLSQRKILNGLSHPGAPQLTISNVVPSTWEVLNSCLRIRKKGGRGEQEIISIVS